MAERLEETLDDNHTEDWSSGHSSEGKDTAEVYTLIGNFYRCFLCRKLGIWTRVTALYV